MMRRILVDAARARGSLKRGGLADGQARHNTRGGKHTLSLASCGGDACQIPLQLGTPGSMQGWRWYLPLSRVGYMFTRRENHPHRWRPRLSGRRLPNFADSVVSPAISPDGRMLAFIRGPETFVGEGQIYVKLLPNGEPVPLTHDEMNRMSAEFLPTDRGSLIPRSPVLPGTPWPSRYRVANPG
jgi:hypothetical protein